MNGSWWLRSDENCSVNGRVSNKLGQTAAAAAAVAVEELVSIRMVMMMMVLMKEGWIVPINL